ncbi:sensor histidine kinase [Telmatobacter bradus]|jgi:signal transduction histidine kinase|uniref:sensor histidine kinase n=1 Tax=Telmatobacter bradus TaxID=474953 RepID=UPI003B431247
MVTLPVIVDQWFSLSAKLQASDMSHSGHSQTFVQITFCAIVLAICLGFGAAFWWNTRDAGTDRPTKVSIILLIVQLALSVVFTETMFIVSAELPFMMPIRQARKWLVAQCVVLLALTAVALSMGNFVPEDALVHTPLFISVPGTILYMLTWTWFAFGAGYLAVSETRNHRELARTNAELMAMQSLLSDETRMAERLRISRELHDVVGHHLAGLSINLQLASHLVEGPAAKTVNEAHLVAKLLLAEVREVVGGLRDPRQSDLRGAIELLSHGIAGLSIHLELPENLDRVDPTCAHVIFRCVQEAITNAIKHAHASNLWVELRRSETGWEIQVRDDGKGAANIVSGNGLKGMKERLEEVGGTLQFESQLDKGFTIQAFIPVSGEFV